MRGMAEGGAGCVGCKKGGEWCRWSEPKRVADFRFYEGVCPARDACAARGRRERPPRRHAPTSPFAVSGTFGEAGTGRRGQAGTRTFPGVKI